MNKYPEKTKDTTPYNNIAADKSFFDIAGTVAGETATVRPAFTPAEAKPAEKETEGQLSIFNMGVA